MATSEIARVSGRGEVALEQRIAAAEPVIFAELMRDWPALGRWSIDYFRERCGDARVLVAETPRGRLAVSSRGIPQATVRFGDFLDGLARGERERYLITPARDTLAPLLEDVRFPRVFQRARWRDIRLWVGPAGIRTPLHRDLPRNLFAQVFGEKTVILIPPSERRHIPTHGMFSGAPNFSTIDAEAPDLERHPNFARVQRFSCVVHAGEILYIPPLWWHQLDSTSPSASVSLWFADGLRALLAQGAQAYARLRHLRP